VKGFFYPVVARGLSRIRVQLSAAHRPEHIERAVAVFTKVGKTLGVLG
jgi:glycine C-acetyltransferase